MLSQRSARNGSGGCVEQAQGEPRQGYKGMKPATVIKALYNRDLNLWFLETIALLKERDFENIDLDNLIEELEGLAGRDRRELESRLGVLLSHLLKRLYVTSSNDYRGWQSTIREQQRQLKLLLKQSPSLRNYFIEVFSEAWNDALLEVRQDYPQVQFPDEWQYNRDVESILSKEFWY